LGPICSEVRVQIHGNYSLSPAHRLQRKRLPCSEIIVALPGPVGSMKTSACHSQRLCQNCCVKSSFGWRSAVSTTAARSSAEERLSPQDAACPCPASRGLPPLSHMRGRCTSMPHGRPAHYRLHSARPRKSVLQRSVAIALVPPDAQKPPPRPAGGSHCLGYHLGRAGEWQGSSEGPISRARQPLRAPR
jgi:hypothetical protein